LPVTHFAESLAPSSLAADPRTLLDR
jgi:hypothetical protein